MYRAMIIILLFCCVQAHAQKQRQNGILLDKKSAEAIAGAVIQNRFDTTVTQKDGQFSIRMADTQSQLKISHPGYRMMLVAPKSGRTFFPLFMSPVLTFSGPTDTLSDLLPHSDTLVVGKAIKAYRNETYKQEKENPFMKTDWYPYTAFTLNNGHAAYNNIRRFLLQDKKVPAAAVRIGEMLNYFSLDDSIPVQYSEYPLQAYADISICPWNKKHYLMRMAVQPEKKPHRSRKFWNIVLLIDVSGSMSSSDKLPLLKMAFKQLIIHLQPEDTLTIVTYTGKTKVALPPTSGNEKLKMLETIEQLHAGGTTAGSKGIKKAFELAKKHFIPGGNNRVILATDGDFNVGKSTDGEMKKLILKYHDWHIGLTCIGVGSGNYKDSKLETIAEWGQGTFAYIDNKAEALRIFNKTQFKRMAVAARNVRLKILFNPGQISAFRLLGYDSDGKHAKYAFVKKRQLPGGEIGINQRMTAYVELVPATDFEILKENPPVTLILQYKNKSETKEYIQICRPSGPVVSFHNKNTDWRFGASVTLFGMLLQQSEYIGEGSYRMAETIAKKAKAAIPKKSYQNFRRLLRKGRK